MTNRLTIDWLSKLIATPEIGAVEVKLARQLLTTMQELESLKGAALALILQAVPGGEKLTVVQNRHIKRLADCLKSNEVSDSIA